MNRTVKFISENFGKYDGLDIDKYLELGGFTGLKNAINGGSLFTIDEIKKSTLRGRGGAAYPTYKKWEMAYKRESEKKYVLCNADEGEPGTFKDRELLNRDPYKVIEGLTIAGITVGATEGFIYIREEYKHIQKKFVKAVKLARRKGFLGENILNSKKTFDIKVYTGAGAYICGENSSLIESMEGKAGRPRIKPPRIGEKGFMGVPTMVNNVETLSAVSTILKYGSDVYSKYGTEESKGTKLISLCGNVKRPGTYEIPFGTTLEEIIYDIGGGSSSKYDIKFVQLGGASGPIMPRKMFDTPYTYEDFKKREFQIGSGAVLVVNEGYRIIDFLEAVQDFFYHESCGKCTPCREGKRQLNKILSKVARGEASRQDIKNIEKIARVMKYASFCGLGQSAPTAILSVIKYFPSHLCEDMGNNDIE